MTQHTPEPRIDLDQARTRAKELLARTRVDRPGAKLVEAQHDLARELGHRSWPELVRATERFHGIAADDVAWERITRLSVVCFVEDVATPGGADVVLHRSGDRWVVPTGTRLAGEDVWDETVLRVPLAAMGFRRQGTHVLALDSRRRHVVFWVDGGRYTGTRLPSRSDVAWWTGPAAQAVVLLDAQGDGALARLVAAADEDRRTMSYEQHAADLHRTLVGSYLRAATPQGGSGFGGSDQDWRDSRGQLADALDLQREHVDFLDLCCANGHLAVSMVGWGAERGVRVTPYGVDVAAELVERARADHPDLGDRFWTGDAMTWTHPTGRRFDLVHMLYDVVPAEHWAALTRHLLDEVVAPGGRLLVSHYGELPASMSPESIVTGLGLEVAGRTGLPHRDGRPRGFASVWVTC